MSILNTDDDDNSLKKINAVIRGKLGVNPSEIKDVEEWVEAYSQADYLMKIERMTMYSAVKQAVGEIVHEMFKKEDDET